MTAKFKGESSLRVRQRSSSKVTSIVQWRLFSTPQWARAAPTKDPGALARGAPDQAKCGADSGSVGAQPRGSSAGRKNADFLPDRHAAGAVRLRQRAIDDFHLLPECPAQRDLFAPVPIRGPSASGMLEIRAGRRARLGQLDRLPAGAVVLEMRAALRKRPARDALTGRKSAAWTSAASRAARDTAPPPRWLPGPPSRGSESRSNSPPCAGRDCRFRRP